MKTKQKTLDNGSFKKELIVIVLLCLFIGLARSKAHGQPVIFAGAGMNEKAYIIGELKLGYQINKVTVGYSQKAYLSSDAPAYFGGFGSYDLSDRIALTGGCYYKYQSADRNKDENGNRVNYWTGGIGLNYKSKINDIGLMYLDNHVQLTLLFGLNVKLYNQ